MRTHLLAITAGLLLAARALGQSPPAPDPFAGDARLATKRTIAVAGAPLPSLLADLTKQTGIRFVADATIADDKSTVYAHDRPLGGTLAALARFFRFAWKREGAAPDWTYRLYQPPKGRAAEEAERDARLLRVADRILTELRAATATGDGATPAVVVARLLEGATPADIAKRLRSGPETWCSPTEPGEKDAKELPHSAAEAARQLTGERFGIAPTDYARVWLTLDGQASDLPALTVTISIERPGFRHRGPGTELDSFPHRASNTEPGEATAPLDWSNNPTLTAHLSFTADPSPTSPPTTAGSAPAGPLTQVARALEQQRQFDLIADAFWSDSPVPVWSADRGLGDLLTEIARDYQHRWWLDDGFVMLRSLDYADRRDAEPPAAAYRRWTEAARTGDLPLDCFADLSALADSANRSTSGAARRLRALWTLTPEDQPHLRFWRSLSRAQQLQAVEIGLSYGDLSSEEKALYLTAAGIGGTPDHPNASSEALNASVFELALGQANGRAMAWRRAGRGGRMGFRNGMVNGVFVGRRNGAIVMRGGGMFTAEPALNLEFRYGPRGAPTETHTLVSTIPLPAVRVQR